MSRTALNPDEPDFDISNDEDVSALLFAEENHFWHRARNRVIQGRLAALGIRPPSHVLDLGCGAGCVASDLSRAGYVVTGVDGHASLLAIAGRRAPRASFVCHDLRQGSPPVDGGPFDAVALFDVIEHLQEPLPLLTMALGLARRGGVLVGTVPALMSLWSRIDEHAGHKTRYGASGLKALLGRLPGAEAVDVRPFFRMLVPVMWLQRRVVGRKGDAQSAARNLAVPQAPLNQIMDGLCRAEERLCPWMNWLRVPGASLWFAVRRA